MSLKDRINECLQDKGVKKADLARATKSPRATISDWTSGKTKKLSGEKLLLVAEFFSVSPKWLETGKGSKHLSTAVMGRDVPDSVLKSIGMSRPDYDFRYIVEEMQALGKVPLITWPSVADWCKTIENYAHDNVEEWLCCPAAHGKRTYALRINHDVMTSAIPGAKTYPAGSILYVDPDIKVTSNRRVIAYLTTVNEVIFRQYIEDAGKKWLMPIDPRYEKILIDESVFICGVVIAKYETE